MYVYIYIIKHICLDIGSYVYLYYLFDESIRDGICIYMASEMYL